MKRAFIHIFLLAGIQLLFLIPLFRFPFYQSHDGELHLARFAAFITAFQDGHIPPRWAGNLNYGFGTPVLSFFAPLAGYLASGLYFIGFDLATAFKIIIGSAFLFAPIAFYFWLSQTSLRRFAFVGALLFGLAPYQFLNLYVRGDIGELLGMLFFPLTLAFIERIKRQSTWTNFVAAAIVFAQVILSHNAVALMFTPIILFYTIFFSNRKERWKSLAALGVGLGISAYFWIPALADQRHLNSQLFTHMFRDHFATLSGLMYKQWGFGTEINKLGGQSPQIGPILFVLVLVAIVLLKRVQKERRHILFWFIVLLISVFLSTQTSSFFWERLPMLSKLQFPWRFVSVASFAGVVLATHTLNTINKRWVTLLVAALALAMSIPIAKISNPIITTDEAAFSHKGTTALHGEATTRWTAGDASETPSSPVEIVAGAGMINNVIRKTGRHTFTTTSDTGITILDNTSYFPGWKAYIDGKETLIEFQNPNHRGLITFTVPTGKHIVQVFFKETRLRQVTNLISLLSLGFVIVLSGLSLRGSRA